MVVVWTAITSLVRSSGELEALKTAAAQRSLLITLKRKSRAPL